MAKYLATDVAIVRSLWAAVLLVGVFTGVAASSLFPKGLGQLMGFLLLFVGGLGSLLCYAVAWVMIPKSGLNTETPNSSGIVAEKNCTTSALAAELIKESLLHSRREVEHFLKSTRPTVSCNLEFEAFALVVAATMQAAEDLITGPIWNVFALEYTNQVGTMENRDELNTRLTIYAAASTIDRANNEIAATSRTFVKFCVGEDFGLEELMSHFKGQEFDSSLLLFGGRTFLRGKEWAGHLIKQRNITA